ncbi:SapB/AmfS family lanthipeptide [Allonocardiopsis opalescens]|uniref:Uncharacterized protein n=1 Tax=Allonocardiopsis opalescens TaxID=1144618 RepID=A0A2T0Q759_9ACTN|nr:SapB/AmfS family lanthipeptide [Allonocardiopsis opalescens]PRX99667.1 hypothetical protein CLV72_103272 [Allonocardiopsis opalescens]
MSFVLNLQALDAPAAETEQDKAISYLSLLLCFTGVHSDS